MQDQEACLLFCTNGCGAHLVLEKGHFSKIIPSANAIQFDLKAPFFGFDNRYLAFDHHKHVFTRFTLLDDHRSFRIIHLLCHRGNGGKFADREALKYLDTSKMTGEEDTSRKMLFLREVNLG